MSSKLILQEDWSDYDNRKKKGQDSKFFSCEEDWEVDYLTDKIHKRYSHILKEKIKEALRLCCKTTPAPRPRKMFVECVMKRLGLDNDNSGGNPPPNPGQGPKNPPTPPGERKVGKK